MPEEKTILIVEDEKPMLQILSDRLELEGFKVLTAVDGEEGLASALEHHPDLIILDILMPKMNGAEMLKKLIDDEWGKSVDVVCLTNLENVPKSIQEFMKTNDNIDYLVKFRTRLDGIIEHAKKRLNMSQ